VGTGVKLGGRGGKEVKEVKEKIRISHRGRRGPTEDAEKRGGGKKREKRAA